jgi:hypothetical protein
MHALRRISLTIALSVFALQVGSAQTPLVLADAELAIPFGAAKGQITLVADQLVFVSGESPKSSLAISRGDITKLERSGDVITIITRRQLRDSDGERDTFKFRMSQSSNVMRWYETAASATPSASSTSPTAAASPTGILASYAVKHDHIVGTCSGTLILSDTAVTFESPDNINDARIWKLIDIKKVEQNGVYKLKVEPFQGDTFNFELSGKGIDSSEFRQLVDRIARARAR